MRSCNSNGKGGEDERKDHDRRLPRDAEEAESEDPNLIQLFASEIVLMTKCQVFIRVAFIGDSNRLPRPMRQRPISDNFSSVGARVALKITEFQHFSSHPVFDPQVGEKPHQNRLCFGIASLITVKRSSLQGVGFFSVVVTSESGRQEPDCPLVDHANLDASMVGRTHTVPFGIGPFYANVPLSINKSGKISKISFYSHKHPYSVVV